MKRRDLIKAGLISLVACSLAGCTKNKETESEILPEKTGTYEISTVLPFRYDLIDEICEINSRYKKSKVVTLYNNTPLPSTKNYNSWVMVLRGENKEVKGHKDFLKFAQYAKDKGFEICYLMNSPKPFSKEDFDTFKKDFYYLLDSLYDSGIKSIKVANTQIASLINDYKYEFELSASTAFEYHNTSQYINLVKNYPNFNLFDISIDENHNFPFLKNLKTIFPDKKIEMIVNESCIKGCPARISHISELFMCKFKCDQIIGKDPFKSMFKMPAIFPWDLEYYSAIGINNFKVTSRLVNRANTISEKYLNNYMNCIENGVGDYSLSEFVYDMYGMNAFSPTNIDIKLSRLKPYLLDIEYFTKYGDLCASKCGATCFRCEAAAKKFEEALNIIIRS